MGVMLLPGDEMLDLPCGGYAILTTYDTGRKDLIVQTGPDHYEWRDQAAQILRDRSMIADLTCDCIGMQGCYYPVEMIGGSDEDRP